jgi:hypothetical protein
LPSGETPGACAFAPSTILVFFPVPTSTGFSFYGLSIGLELLLLAFILRTAWTCPGRGLLQQLLWREQTAAPGLCPARQR